MRTRGEGVKNPENFADVLYEWSLSRLKRGYYCQNFFWTSYMNPKKQPPLYAAALLPDDWKLGRTRQNSRKPVYLQASKGPDDADLRETDTTEVESVEDVNLLAPHQR